MMSSEVRPYYAIAHVASQLVYKYLPVDQAIAISPISCPLPIDEWDEAQWVDWLRQNFKNVTEALPWWTSLMQGRLSRDRLLKAITQHFRVVNQKGASYLLLCDRAYPQLLREIADPPLGLTILGDSEILTRPCISVVGSRRASSRTLNETFRMGQLLVDMGQVVVSGGAYGCDIAAHQGVLSACRDQPIPAVVVLPGGLGHQVPNGNTGTFREIQRGGGVLMSERLWDSAARPMDYPIRNRIISGFSWVTVVMQAGERSGAMVTARLAGEQSREVCVLSQSSEDPNATGSCQLIDEGAVRFDHADELFELLCCSHSREMPP